jgi:hypothetical protein
MAQLLAGGINVRERHEWPAPIADAKESLQSFVDTGADDDLAARRPRDPTVVRDRCKRDRPTAFQRHLHEAAPADDERYPRPVGRERRRARRSFGTGDLARRELVEPSEVIGATVARLRHSGVHDRMAIR